MKKKKLLSCILATVCCSLFFGQIKIQAEETWPQGPSIESGSAIVMDVNSGTVLYEKNCHESLYPASTTKILTALLAIENTELDEKVTFSYDSVHKTEGSSIWRDVDEVMTMEQCLYALMLNSANECAYAIAEHTGGTYEQFIQMMNDRAALLGCEDTHFSNPHGLTEEDHYTSCYDLALISKEALKNELFCKIAATKRYDIPPTNKHPDETTYLTNHQKMLWEGEEYYYEYCIGGKTGYTEAAGNTLVTFAEKDGMKLVCVIMKGKHPGHYEDTIKLLNYAFENFKAYNIAENLDEDMVLQLPENDFLKMEAFADIDKTAGIVLPIDAEFSEAKLELIEAGTDKDIAGTLQYTYGERVVGSVDVKRTEQEVKEYPFEAFDVNQEEEPEKVIRIDWKWILIVIAAVIVLGAAGFGIYKLGDNFYLIRYKLMSRKANTIKTDVIQRKRRKRRR